MTYNLNKDMFINDFYFLELESGNTIAFNIIDEQLKVDEYETDINEVNIAVVLNNEEQIHTTSVIGIETPYYTLTTKYKEYLGKTLTKDNMQYVQVEVV